MKANQAYLNKNDRAEVGVGTLIVFIAMVLVAAVAAAVLINTTGTLQQRAQSTGKEATQEVSSNLKVFNVYGTRDGTPAAGDIMHLQTNVGLAAGATSMDMTKLIIRYSDGTNTVNYAWEAYDGTPSDAAHFQATWIRGNGDGSASNSVMLSGDLVQIILDTPAGLATRTSVSVSLIPETGSPVESDFKTPATYGSDASITLR